MVRLAPPTGNPLYEANSGVGGFVTVALVYVVIVYFLYTLITVESPTNFVIQNSATPSVGLFTDAPPIRASVVALFLNTTCDPFDNTVTVARPTPPSYCSLPSPVPLCLAMAYTPMGLPGTDVTLSFPLRPGAQLTATDVTFVLSGINPDEVCA